LCKIETQQLLFIRNNQKLIRAELYQNAVDAVHAGDLNAHAVGHKVILPASYNGSPRQMHRKYMNSMAIAAKYGKADLFLTMTTNPNWAEIKNELLDGQSSDDRPDLVARVFKMKMESLLDDLLKKEVLGKTCACIWVVEWQKRGLLHIHILLWLADGDRLKTPTDYDRIVSAEIPDPVSQPEVHEAVVKHNLHVSLRKPCSSSASPALHEWR
jgi:ATP-dependent DNA helicase PIF1